MENILKAVDGDYQRGLLEACKRADIKTVGQYLTCSSLGDRVNINEAREMYKYNVYNPLTLAVEVNSLSLVEYLLTSQELKEHADINMVVDGKYALSIAVASGYEDIVDFLLNSAQLIEHAKVFPTERYLELAFDNGERKIVEKENVCYLALEKSIISKKTSNINILNKILSHPDLVGQENLVKENVKSNLERLFDNNNLNIITHLLVNGYVERDEKLKKHIEDISDRGFYNGMVELMNTLENESWMESNIPTGKANNMKKI